MVETVIWFGSPVSQESTEQWREMFRYFLKEQEKEKCRVNR